MADNTNKFTIEVKGLPLTDDQRATISEALNETLMQQIGGMDFRGKAASTEALAGGSPFGYVIGIDGSLWERIARNSDFFKNVLQRPQFDKSLSAGVKNITIRG